MTVDMCQTTYHQKQFNSQRKRHKVPVWKFASWLPFDERNCENNSSGMQRNSSIYGANYSRMAKWNVWKIAFKKFDVIWSA